MNPMNKETTRTYKNFQQLRREKGLASREVADTAKISLTEEYLFEIGAVVDKEIKYRIIQAFSQLTGQSYTLSDFEPVNEQPTVVMNKMDRLHGFVGGSRELH